MDDASGIPSFDAVRRRSLSFAGRSNASIGGCTLATDRYVVIDSIVHAFRFCDYNFTLSNFSLFKGCDTSYCKKVSNELSFDSLVER